MSTTFPSFNSGAAWSSSSLRDNILRICDYVQIDTATCRCYCSHSHEQEPLFDFEPERIVAVTNGKFETQAFYLHRLLAKRIPPPPPGVVKLRLEMMFKGPVVRDGKFLFDIK